MITGKWINACLYASLVILLLASCAKSPDEKFLGEWRVINKKGETETMVLGEDGSVSVTSGSAVSDGSWKLDANGDLIFIDLRVPDERTKPMTFLGIAHLVGKDKLQTRFREKSFGRPTEFTEDHDYNQSIFERAES